ncbi:MAG: hypothetical protein EOS11_10270 [Mesorhizobium sp.]|nr:MAG: hypothetical protein EOS11_10270 [Mesorhizobium sp.]
MSEWCELDEMEARTLKRFPDVSGILMELAHAIARGEIGYRRIEGAKVVSVYDLEFWFARMAKETFTFDMAVAQAKIKTGFEEKHLARLLESAIDDNSIDASIKPTTDDDPSKEYQFLAEWLATGCAPLPPSSPYKTFPYSARITKASLERWIAGLLSPAPVSPVATADEPEIETSAQRATIVRAMRELWNGAIPLGLTKKKRDGAIEAFARDNAITVPSTRTIRRFFSGQ